MNNFQDKGVNTLWDTLTGAYLDQHYPYEFGTYENAIREFIKFYILEIDEFIKNTEAMIQNEADLKFFMSNSDFKIHRSEEFKKMNPHYEEYQMKRFLKIFEDLKSQYQKMKEEGSISKA
ncbi:MAG TPA: hypothetical protein VGE63_01250 [Candidatus Paceibacterota bacterium]